MAGIGKEKLWLIKSSGRIIGPLDREQVGDLLRDREINYLDEVSSPMRRWQSLQHHPEFEEIVDSVRKNNLGDTTQGGWTSNDISALTQTMTDLATSELTDEITNPDNFTKTDREIVVTDVAEQVLNKPNATAGRFQAKGQGVGEIDRQVESSSRWLWVLTAVILCFVGYYVFRQRSLNSPQAPPTLEALRQQAFDAVQTGAYQEAIKMLRSTADPSQLGELGVLYGALLIQVEKQTVLGKRILVPLSRAGGRESKQVLTALGIADLTDGRYDQADDNFAKAIAVDPGFLPAQINRIIVANGQRNYSQAHRQALSLMNRGSRDGILYLSYANSVLGQISTASNLTSAQLSMVNEATKWLRQYLMVTNDYATEVALHLLNFERLSTGKISEESLISFLDRDPLLTDLYRHNLFIYRGDANWQGLFSICQKMTEGIADSVFGKTLLASCNFRNGNLQDAKSLIETASRQDPKDALVQSWQSLILKQAGQADQASVILGRAGELNRRGEFSLPYVLQARFCADNGDVDCAQESWQKLYERDLNSVLALGGLAQALADKKSFAESKRYLEKGLKVSSDYIPLLKLQMRAVKEKW